TVFTNHCPRSGSCRCHACLCGQETVVPGRAGGGRQTGLANLLPGRAGAAPTPEAYRASPRQIPLASNQCPFTAALAVTIFLVSRRLSCGHCGPRLEGLPCRFPLDRLRIRFFL